MLFVAYFTPSSLASLGSRGGGGIVHCGWCQMCGYNLRNQHYVSNASILYSLYVLAFVSKWEFSFNFSRYSVRLHITYLIVLLKCLCGLHGTGVLADGSSPFTSSNLQDHPEDALWCCEQVGVATRQDKNLACETCWQLMCSFYCVARCMCVCVCCLCVVCVLSVCLCI